MVKNLISTRRRMVELTLYNGDCLEIMKEIPNKSIDLIICDLPYGCLAGVTRNEKQHALGQGETYIKDGKETFGCAWDVKIDLEKFWEQVRRIRKSDNTPTIHFCTTRFGIDLINSNQNEFRYDLVWDKQRGVSFLDANRKPMRSHEMIYIFSKAGAYYNRKDIEGDFKEHKQYGKAKTDGIYGVLNRKKPITTPVGTITSTANKRCVLSVIKPSNPYVERKKEQHPTEKPESLYRFLIERYCPDGGTVLDPTFGSGNSVFTAYSMGRNAIGIEKNEAFFEKAVKRLNSLP